MKCGCKFQFESAISLYRICMIMLISRVNRKLIFLLGKKKEAKRVSIARIRFEMIEFCERSVTMNNFHIMKLVNKIIIKWTRDVYTLNTAINSHLFFPLHWLAITVFTAFFFYEWKYYKNEAIVQKRTRWLWNILVSRFHFFYFYKPVSVTKNSILIKSQQKKKTIGTKNII